MYVVCVSLVCIIAERCTQMKNFYHALIRPSTTIMLTIPTIIILVIIPHFIGPYQRETSVATGRIIDGTKLKFMHVLSFQPPRWKRLPIRRPNGRAAK